MYFKDGTFYLLKMYLTKHDHILLFNHTTYPAIRNLFERIKKQIGINKFHPHMLRHTFASILHRNGTSIFILMTLLGHENIKATERYVHFDNEYIYQQFKLNMNY